MHILVFRINKVHQLQRRRRILATPKLFLKRCQPLQCLRIAPAHRLVGLQRIQRGLLVSLRNLRRRQKFIRIRILHILRIHLDHRAGRGNRLIVVAAAGIAHQQLQLLPPRVKVRRRLAHALVQPRCILPVELLRRYMQVRLNRLWRCLQRRKRPHHPQHRIVAPLRGDVVQNRPRLPVAHHHLLRILREDEPLVHLRDRQQFLVADRLHHLWRQPVRPQRVRLPLLVYRQPLREPPRHAIVSRAQDEHVTHLMPHRRAPVEVPRPAPRRAIHRHHVAKRHPQRPQPRHPHRPHRKVLVVRVHLQLHRPA